MTSDEYVPSTSDDAVRNATGRTWRDWFDALDAAGAQRMDHKEIVAWLRDEAGLGHAWWQQNVTVEYEKARGKRAPVGETADAGFQVGAQRTVAAPAPRVWELLTGQPGLETWLGRLHEPPLEEGRSYRTEDGTRGEIRTLLPERRLRLTWQPPGWERPTTLQITLTPKGDRCTIGFHHERLPDAGARQAMRERWKGALADLAQQAGRA